MRRLGFLLVFFTMAPAAPGAEPVIWLEAERFEEAGGWVNDSQFVDLMGSPYLLAAGVGKPVADAVTHVGVPGAGTYRLWVRCKDWLPKHSPGQFQVLVGGKASAVTFGRAKTDTWQWVDGGEFQLAAGKVEVRLHDRTGWWGRCDAVVLSAGDFEPAGELAALAQQRQTHLGVSAKARDKGPYDVVVVGGGLSGCAAAVAAARHGCKVALIQDRPVLGGNASSEIQVPVQGDQSREPFDPHETGIIEEFHPTVGSTGRSKEIERIVRAEKNLDLHLNTRATGVEPKDAKVILAVLALGVRRGERMRFAGRLFIDCTGHGWVGYWAGAEYRHGREARSEFNESLAPEKADGRTMGNTLNAAGFRTRAKPVSFIAPPWAYQWTSPSEFEPLGSHRRQRAGRPPNFDRPSRGKGRQPRPTDPNGAIHRTWWVEYGGMLHTVTDAEKIRDELFRINVGLWDYAKNYNPRTRAANANRELVWLNYVPGVRESRRLVGDYILAERDFTRRIVHKDTAAYTGWGIDIHHPEGFWVRGNDCMHYHRFKVSIPYRSLYSKNIDNLLMAGRCHSATHVAMGATRIMRSCCLMGQAAGTAAAVARDHKTTPRGVYRRHLAAFQQMLLRDGCYLMGVPNADPADLARKAKASASSCGSYRPRRAADLPHGGTIHRMDVDRAVMFPAPGERIEAVAFYLRSEAAKPVTITARLRRAKAFGDFSGTDDLATAAATVPPRSRGWVEFPIKAKTEKGKHYYAVLPATAGMRWDLYPRSIPNHCRAYRREDWTPMKACYKFRLTPGGEPTPPVGDARGVTLGPENVINGWNRAVAGTRNAWAPDPKQKLPQWLQLDLPEPATLTCLHVTFQTRAHIASAFRVETWTAGKWQIVTTVTNNTLRRRVLRFDPIRTAKVRLVFPKAAPGGAVCEIRLYANPPRSQEVRSPRQ